MYFLDSLYLALSADTIDEVVKPSHQEEWKRVKPNWICRQDTPEIEAFDLRTPGSLKFLICLITLILLYVVINQNRSYHCCQGRYHN